MPIEKLLSPYSLIVILVAILRIAELFWSKRNANILAKLGGFEVRGRHFTTMKLVHTFWLICTLMEFLYFERSYSQFQFGLFGGFVLLGMTLRYLAIATLGNRWTVTIWILPGVPAVKKGIYNVIKHPNYLGVIIELFALPMMVNSWMSALLFSILNGLVLSVRIPSEEEELKKHSSYSEMFSNEQRFIPKVI